MFDFAIIGAGPAGMSAAIYARRAGLSTAVFEGEVCGGQMTLTPEVENYPGLSRVSGAELSFSMYEQMTALGATLINEKVTAVKEKDGIEITTEGGSYCAKTLLIANGAKRRRLGIVGEEKNIGRGVSYCAVCDGMFFKGKSVCVVGGGNTALEDALYLSGICEKVYLIHRRDTFRAQKHFCDKVARTENIETVLCAVPTEIIGEDRVSALVVEVGGERRTIETSAVFVAVGLVPENEIFEGFVALDGGYIVAGEDTHTSREGVFAAGDTRTKSLRQIVTAASDGAVAASEAEKYLNLR